MSIKKTLGLLLILTTSINSFGYYERTRQFDPEYYQPELTIVCAYVSDWYKKDYFLCNDNRYYTAHNDNRYYTAHNVASWMETAINSQSISATRLLEIVALLSSKNVSDTQKFASMIQIIEKEQSESADEKIAQANADQIENKKRQNKRDIEFKKERDQRSREVVIRAIKEAGMAASGVLAIACFLDMGIRAYAYTLGYNVDKWLRTYNNIPNSKSFGMIGSLF